MHGPPEVETVQVTRPSTLQEFVDGMRLPITGALQAAPKKTRVSKQRDDTIVLIFFVSTRVDLGR